MRGRAPMIAIAFLTVAACTDHPTPSQPPDGAAYRVRSNVPTDLGTLGGPGSSAYAINPAGQVVGVSWLPGIENPRGFLWDKGRMTDLGTLGGSWTQAHAINPAGHIAGGSSLSGQGFHAFVWKKGQMTDLGSLGGWPDYSMAYGVNPAGVVVGFSKASGTFPPPGPAENEDMPGLHAFKWENGEMTDLGTLGGPYSIAHAINPAGDIVGSSSTTGGLEVHAVMWKDGDIIDLGTMGGERSEAMAINPAGQVVGSAYTASGQRAFIWEKGVMKNLGTLGGSWSHAYGIDVKGRVIGVSSTAGDYSFHPFIWENGVMRDLGVLDHGRMRGAGARAINPAGVVVGWGYVGDTHSNALLWDTR